ncbi:hypothetical protein [Bradyrhizobium sp. STM 3809]|uniref:hypothetical protein n=1 Tax=Bradyrhizobium sp. STM 3809 TaxID=551936 RepID=UPI0002409886|nr:hypothetical protein [Bradyrhizobium sp. STM 3809]CCE01787.1 exported hypothetical protein [Bradyrhizobium sp. STM 3809]
MLLGRGRRLLPALGLLGASMPLRAAWACSLVNPETSIARAVATAQTWWLASALVAAAIVVIEIRRERRPRRSSQLCCSSQVIRHGGFDRTMGRIARSQMSKRRSWSSPR